MVRPTTLFLVLLSSAGAFLAPTVPTSKRAEIIMRANSNEKEEALSAKLQYEKSVEEYNRLERLIKQSAAADEADGHTLETVFNNEDVAEIAELMMEKATEAAAAKALYEEELAHLAAVTAKQAGEEATMLQGMAQKAAQEVHVMEEKVRDIEAFDDVADEVERRRDMSALHAAKHTLQDATQLSKESKLAKDQARFDEAHSLKESILLKLNEAELREDRKALHDVIVEKSNEEFKAEHKQP